MKKLLTIILTALLLFNASLTVNVTRADEFEEQNTVEEVIREKQEEAETEKTVPEEEKEPEEIQEESFTDDEEKTVQEEQEKDYVIPELTFVEDEFDTSGLLHDEVPDYRKSLKAESLPSRFTLGSDALTAVRNQGSYGTCWSFSTIASLESTYKKDNGKNLDLSELHLAYFAFHSKGVSDPLGLISSDGGAITSEILGIKSPGTYLNIGGNYYISMYTLASGVGLVKENVLPYTDAANDVDGSLCYNSNYILDEVKLFNISERNVIKKAIYNDGAVGISMYYDDSCLYNGSYYYNAGTDSNHAVTLVGWDDNYSKDNFSDTNRPSGDGAWLVRNSWGTSFGDNGYFWMSYEDTSIADGTAAQFFIERNNFTYLYQYDGSAGTKYIYTYPSSSIYTGNIYKAQHDESLTEVGFYTYQTGIEYEIKVYKKSGSMSNPTDGTLVSSATTCGILSDAGFHTVELAQKVDLNKDEYFSVVVNYKKSGGQIQVRYDITENYVSGSYFTNSASTGESFIKESDTKSWKDCYNLGTLYHGTARIKAYTIDEKVPIETGSFGTDTNFAVYRNGTMVISGSGSTDCQSYEEPTVETCESVNKVIIEEGVTDICDNTFIGFVNLEEIHIPETVELIETGAFNDSNSITDVYYAGEKSEWESLDIADRNTVFVNTDIYFANGQYDKDSRLTVYQDDNDNLIIEGDKAKLDKIAEYTIYDNVLCTYTNGGAVCIYDSEDNCQAYFRNSKKINSEETKEYKAIEYNEDNTALAVSKDILLSASLVSGDTRISLETDSGCYEFEFNLRGGKKLESQPVITLLDNGDLKIEADSEYLTALMHNCTEMEISESQHAQIEFIHSNSHDKAGDYYQNDYAEIFRLSEDQTYVIYSNSAQFEIYNGAIINGENKVTLRAYGYEPSEPVTLNFIHNCIPAPDDVTALYDSEMYTLEVSSKNTDWLKQIRGICIAETDNLSADCRYSGLSIEVIGNTCYIPLIGNGIPDGTYNIAVWNGGYCWYNSDGFYSNSCNKEVITSLELNDIPGRRSIADLKMEFNADGLVITSSDDGFLNQLTRNSDGNKTDEEILDYADSNIFSFMRDSYIIVSDGDEGNRIVLRNTENNRIIEKSEDKVTVSFDSLQEAGMKIFKNWTYQVKVGSFGYHSAQYYCSSQYGSNVSKIPSDLKISEGSDGSLIIKTKDSNFLNNIRYLTLYDDEQYCNIHPEDMTISAGKAVIDADIIKLAKKSYNIQIQSYGYERYQKNNAITLKKHTLKTVADFECEISESGNLIITSEDTEWIDGLVENSNYSCHMVYARLEKEQIRYVNTFSDKGQLYNGIEKINDNSAVVYSSTLKNFGITSGKYKLQFRVSGYEISEETVVVFTGLVNNIPSDITKELKDGHLYIYTDDKAFIDSVAENDLHCHYVDLEYQTTYDSTADAYTVNWPIEVSGLWGRGASGLVDYVDVVKDSENGVLDFDLSDFELDEENRYSLIIGTDGTYPYIKVTVNSDVYSITYNNDHGYTKERLDYLHFYTQGIDIYKYSLKSPVVPGYKFVGWYTDENYKTKVTGIDLKNRAWDIDLYAKFTPLTYTIKYNLNGGTNNKSNKKNYTIETASFDLLAADKKGRIFEGWYDNPEFNGEPITSVETGTYGNIEFYAKWKPATYTITIDVNGGSLPGEYSDNIIEYTVDDSFLLEDPTREYYTFAGWYNGKSKVTSIKTGTTGNMTLTAKWTEGVNYTVIYDANTIGFTGKTANTKITAGKDVKTASCGFKKTGYTFVEWNTMADGSGISYPLKSKITKSEPLSHYGESVTLYAIWKPVEYKITYKNITSADTNNNPSAYTVEDGTIKLTDPVRNGYAFGGWYLDSKFKKPVTEIDVSGAKAVTLYARLVESDFLELMNPGAYISCQGSSYEITRDNLKATTLGNFKFVTYKKVTSLKPDGSIISITVDGIKDSYATDKYYPTALTEIVIEIAG